MSLKKRRITIRDIAREVNVSVATVSRCINSSGYVDAETKKRIQMAIRSMDYSPNPMAQGLKTHHNRIIILVVPDIENPFYSSMSKVIQSIIKNSDYSLVLYNTSENPAEELIAIKSAINMYAAGIIFASIFVSDEVISAISRSEIPTVFANSYESCPYDAVHGVRGMGTDLASSHLIHLGHTQIAFAGGEPHSKIGESRRNGYCAAMNRAGIPIRDSFVYEKGFSQSDGYDVGMYFATAEKLPTAICCANDLIALGVLAAINDKGLQIPEDISITGMDNIAYTKISHPKLTTVTNDSVKFGETATKLLFERINKEYDGKPREVLIKRELIVRDSTDKPRQFNV